MSHTGVGDIWPACTRISRGGGECRRTRGAAKHSTSAAPPSILDARGGCSASSEHLRAPVMPSSTASQSAAAAHTRPEHLSQEMRPRRERGQLDVAASPGNQGHLLSRRLAWHISRHMGESVARPRSLGLAAGAQPRLPTALHDQPASPPSAASRPRRPSSPLRGLPGASAACRPAPQSPARPAPCRPSPAWPARTSARSTNPPTARPNGGPAVQAPAASRCT